MKTILSLILALVININLTAQVCDYIESKDTYGDHLSLKTSPAKLKKAQVKLSISSRKLYLELYANNPSIKTDTSWLELVFNESDTIRLTTRHHGYKDRNHISSPYLYHNTYDINLNTLGSLTKSNLTSFRITNDKEVKISEKLAIKLRAAAECFERSFNKKTDIMLSYTLEPNSTCPFYEYKKDPITDSLYIRLNYTTLGKWSTEIKDGLKLVVSPYSIGSKQYLTLRLNNSKFCIDKESVIVIKLANGERVIMKHIGKTSCKESSRFQVALTPENKKQLQASPISFIRLMIADGQVDISSMEYPGYFMDYLECLK